MMVFPHGRPVSGHVVVPSCQRAAHGKRTPGRAPAHYAISCLLRGPSLGVGIHPEHTVRCDRNRVLWIRVGLLIAVFREADEALYVCSLGKIADKGLQGEAAKTTVERWLCNRTGSAYDLPCLRAEVYTRPPGQVMWI